MLGSSKKSESNESESNSDSLLDIREKVVRCRRCPRLVEYRESVALQKRKEFDSWEYWGKPVPGFGDANASLLIVGLAPAAHGGNRTGRVFTGDRSGDFLYKALFKTGFANQSLSVSRTDGLRLMNAYITAAVKCAPPDNKPSPKETMNCSSYLEAEIDALDDLRVILCLGQFAFRSVVSLMRNRHDLARVRASFAHGRVWSIGPGIPKIICSYHPSPRNTQTGKLTESMMVRVLLTARRHSRLDPDRLHNDS